jgi:hypothetical protein
LESTIYRAFVSFLAGLSYQNLPAIIYRAFVTTFYTVLIVRLKDLTCIKNRVFVANTVAYKYLLSQ